MDRYQIQRVGFVVLGLVAVIVVAPILVVIGAIAVRGIGAVDWVFLTQMPRDGMRAGGIFPAIVGTVWLTLAIMTLPIIISTAEEALRAVPTEFRTVSASLGGTRWQGIRRVVLPQAMPGIITGVILGLLRAAGETAPILFTVAAFFLPRLPQSPLDQTMALPYHLYVIRVDAALRPELLKSLKTSGIGNGVHYPIALPNLEAYRYLGQTPDNVPNATALSKEIISLPMFAELSTDQIDHIAEALHVAMKSLLPQDVHATSVSP